MKLKTQLLAAALASGALVASGAAMAQANMNVGTAAGTTTDSTVQNSNGRIGGTGAVTDSTMATGMHTGTNAGSGPVGNAGITGSARTTGPSGSGMTNTGATVGMQSEQNPGATPSAMRNANGAATNAGANAGMQAQGQTDDSMQQNHPMNASADGRMQAHPGMRSAANSRARPGVNDMTMKEADALQGRTVVGAHGEVLGRIEGTQPGPDGMTDVTLRTSHATDLHGKAVALPAAMFAAQAGSRGQLKAPAVSRKDLRQMPSARNTGNAPSPM